MSKKVIMMAAGVVAGIAVAAAVGVYVLASGGSGTAAEEPTGPVVAEGRLGPHITLQDRVYNLQSGGVGGPAYLKLQTVIEFETPEKSAKKWARVFNGCVARAAPAAREAMVSAMPLAAEAPELDREGAKVDPCTAEEGKLLEEFQHEIGTGRQLIEDAVLTVVSRRTPAEVATPEGKDTLKADIKKAVEQLIHEPKVARVLFTNFIMQ